MQSEKQNLNLLDSNEFRVVFCEFVGSETVFGNRFRIYNWDSEIWNMCLVGYSKNLKSDCESEQCENNTSNFKSFIFKFEKTNNS